MLTPHPHQAFQAGAIVDDRPLQRFVGGAGDLPALEAEVQPAVDPLAGVDDRAVGQDRVEHGGLLRSEPRTIPGRQRDRTAAGGPLAAG